LSNNEIILDESYRNFIESIRSDATRETYDYCLKRYFEFLNNKVQPMNQNIRLIESDIIKYVIYLKNTRKIAYSTISLYLNAITHYYTMNDININRKKINKYLGENQRKVQDRAYTTEEIEKLLEFCDERARAMGYKELEFMRAYYDNIGRQNIEAIENHPLGRAIAKFYEQEIEDKSKDSWEGPPAKLLEQLDKIAEENKINTSHKSWPKEVKWLTRRLNQIRSNLLEGLGIEVLITRVTENVKGKINTSSITIRKMTPLSPMTQVSQIHEGNTQENTGDIISTGVIMSPVIELSPVESDENHAQNSDIGENGETGDIFPISSEETRGAEGEEEHHHQQHKSSTQSATNAIYTILQQEPISHQHNPLYSCYYCDNFETNTKQDYDGHVVLRHPGKLCYPSKTDLER
jgi:integrase-like protein